MKRLLICVLALAILMISGFGCSRPAVKSEYESLSNDEIKLISQLIDLEFELCEKYGDKDYYPAQDGTVKKIKGLIDKYNAKIKEKMEKTTGMDMPEFGADSYEENFVKFYEALDAAEAANTPEYKDYELFENAATQAAHVGIIIVSHTHRETYMEGNEERVPMGEQTWDMFLRYTQSASDNFYQ